MKTDQNVEEVRNILLMRSEAGFKKYGVTTERKDLTELQWLIHAQEEALDLAVYLQRIVNDKKGAARKLKALEKYRNKRKAIKR